MKWEKRPGYFQKTLLKGRLDCFLIHYPTDSEIRPHTDPRHEGKHYRLNIIFKNAKAGGQFVCEKVIFETKRIKFFRPDLHKHWVTKIQSGDRYVLSVGLAL